MGKHDRIKDKAAASDAAAPAPVGEVMPRMALAGGDAPLMEPLEPPKIEMPGIAAPAMGLPKIETAAVEEPKIDLAKVEAPHIAPDMGGQALNAEESPAPEAPADDASAAAPAANAAPGFNRFTVLAAALALSAALGGMAGALAAYGFAQPAPALAAASGRTSLEEFQALKENVVQARVDLAALKASFDAGNRNATTQLTKIGERIERIERSQAEPAAKLSKAIDTLERIARSDANAQRETTGSVAPPQPIVGKPLDGWTVRDVRRGTAIIEGRFGLIEVDQGDVVPGLGRVETIRKQDGRWVVMTSKGFITSAR